MPTHIIITSVLINDIRHNALTHAINQYYYTFIYKCWHTAPTRDFNPKICYSSVTYIASIHTSSLFLSVLED